MYSRRYIELCSTYRDRTRYPNPSQFMVDLSPSGRLGASSAKDPTYNGVMVYPPSNDNPAIANASFGYMYAPVTDGSLAPSEYTVSLLPVSATANGDTAPIPLSPDPNAYVGKTLELVVKTGGATTEHEYRTITDYERTPAQELLTGLVDGTAIAATDIALTTATVDCDIDGFFNGWTVEFVDTTDTDLLGVTRTVSYYRAIDRRVFFNEPIEGLTLTAGDEVALKTDVYKVTLQTPFTVGALPTLDGSCEQAANTTYRIRNSVPRIEGTLAAGSTNTVTLPASVGTSDFTDSLIWITSDPVVASGTLASATATTFTLPAGFANQFADNFMNGMTIEITSGAFDGAKHYIVDYDNGTLTGTVSPPWDSSAGTPGTATFIVTQPHPNNYSLIREYNPTTRVGTISRTFTYTNLTGTVTPYAVDGSTTFEILQFNTDNYNSLDYTTSVVASQQSICYELELNSLILPNVPLRSGIGDTIAFYPYVYVELSSVMQGASTSDLYSNNPNAKKMMFRAPIIHNYRLNEQKYVVTDGHGMVQTVKFSPNDAFQFSVYLPNGDLFMTDADFTSPNEPNPALQISACFSIRRL